MNLKNGSKTKVLQFESISPFFELCRDGRRPFDIRLRDPKDKRFRALSQLRNAFFDAFFDENQIKGWAVKFTNPSTGESFTRDLRAWTYLPVEPAWVIMYLGELVR